jgi:signal transduction histidine kinase
LRNAWITLQPVIQRRKPDKHGRREGSALAVVPLFGSEAPFGLLVMESRNIDAFTDDQMSAVVLAAARVALRLETALLFDEVRSVATAEERDRLAREIHDGVAQELAFLGYRLDELRLIASKVDADLGTRVSDLRKDITDLISNLRLSITDLKTSVSRDRGLGAALGSYIRAIGTGRPLIVHTSLQESPFRLPPDREVALFQLAQIVAQDVRQSGRAANLWVTLTVDPPSASLVVAHDGAVDGTGPDVADARAALEELGGSLTVVPRKGGGITVRATFEGEDDADQRPAG